MLKVYQVLKNFDSKKDYGFDIRPQYGKCLESMKKGEKIDSKSFAKEHKDEFTQRKNTLEATMAVVHQAISIGKKVPFVMTPGASFVKLVKCQPILFVKNLNFLKISDLNFIKIC